MQLNNNNIIKKSIPKDILLYNNIKKKIWEKNPIHSAYRSGMLVNEYKKKYEKKYNNKNAYKGTKQKDGLTRWYKEKWKNQRGEIGYKYKNDIYRPTIKISENTPLTYNELSKNKIKKAMIEKKKNWKSKKIWKIK